VQETLLLVLVECHHARKKNDKMNSVMDKHSVFNVIYKTQTVRKCAVNKGCAFWSWTDNICIPWKRIHIVSIVKQWGHK